MIIIILNSLVKFALSLLFNIHETPEQRACVNLCLVILFISKERYTSAPPLPFLSITHPLYTN